MLKAADMQSIIEKKSPLPKLHPVCFACNEQVERGLKLKFWFAEEQVFTFYTIPGAYDGFPGITHGGIVAAILDETAAWALNVLLKKMGFTQNMTINYLKPVMSNIPIFSVGSIGTNEADHVIVHSHIQTLNDMVVVEANSTWRLIEIEDLPKMIAMNDVRFKNDPLLPRIRTYFSEIDHYLDHTPPEC